MRTMLKTIPVSACFHGDSIQLLLSPSEWTLLNCNKTIKDSAVTASRIYSCPGAGGPPFMVLSGEGGGRAVVGATVAFLSTERAQRKMKNPLRWLLWRFRVVGRSAAGRGNRMDDEEHPCETWFYVWQNMTSSSLTPHFKLFVLFI